MDYKITAPNKEYSGESAGVHFINGEGIAKNGKSIEWFEQKGYIVEPIQEDIKEPENAKESKKSKNKKEAEPTKGSEELKEPEVSAGDLDDNTGNSAEKTEA